ncbi:hypothetical protein ACQP2T_61505 [Nonomuraea sp. CA-143628]|uniref:hypothetical protein n=1 Tax=Nonomuraea sp. CA-143628 TaxID=3239997 RepID=UPI003D8DA128
MIMGAILEPTPEMGPFTCEARGESFCLGCHRDYLAVTPDRVWSIPASQVPALFAAFDQIRAFPAYAADLQAGGDVPAHNIEMRDQHVHVEGLGHAYLGDASTQDWPYRTVEVLYRHVQTLQDAITSAVAGTPTP